MHVHSVAPTCRQRFQSDANPHFDFRVTHIHGHHDFICGTWISQRSCDSDVLMVGGAPVRSTTAALLAEEGWKVVVVLEKEHHPRFHIGESLLPLNLPIRQPAVGHSDKKGANVVEDVRVSKVDFPKDGFSVSASRKR